MHPVLLTLPAGKSTWLFLCQGTIGTHWCDQYFRNCQRRILWVGKSKGGGQRFRAEVSSSRIFQLNCGVTKSIPATRMLLSSLSCLPQVQSCNPPCQLSFSSVTAEAFGGQMRVLRCSGHRCHLCLLLVTKVNHPDVVQGNLSSAHTARHFSREMSSAKSSC